MPGNEYDEYLDDIKDSKEDFGEKIEDINMDQKSKKYVIDVLNDKLDKNNTNMVVTDKIEDKLNNENINNDFLQGIEDKSGDEKSNKDFVKGIEDKLEINEANKDFVEEIEDMPTIFENDVAKEKYPNLKKDSVYNAEQDLDIIKENLKQVNWNEISNDWKIHAHSGRGYKDITLNPYHDCSKSNPLYKHEEWLKWVYTNKELNLNDTSIANICGIINNKTIGNWREKFNIPSKEIGEYIKDGYKFLHMQKEYKHPEFNPIGDRRIYRQEHIIVMENHLNKVLTSEQLSQHPCLIKNDDKYYIKNGSVVHHINHNRLDNRIENLWLYENVSEHNNSNINKCLRDLIKLNQVSFSDGNYYINHDNDYRNLNSEKINEALRQKTLDNYENLDQVKKSIKNMDWSGIDWNIEYKIRNNAPIEKKHLNPKEDCTQKNPLYRHKDWFKRIVRDKRFNLTDRRMSELCGISEKTARRYRKDKYGISGEYRGFERYIGKNSSGKDIIYIKLDKSYGNPYATEKGSFILMREHRYIVEKNLQQKSKLYKDYLIDEKYIKPKCPIHHINLDKLDNRLENLYPCKNSSEHNAIHSSLDKKIEEMLESGLIDFKNGKYYLDI